MRIRFFAGAAEAAGVTHRDLDVPGPLPLSELADRLGAGAPRLATILGVATFLVDGEPTHDRATLVAPDARVDVLPPFAGG